MKAPVSLFGVMLGHNHQTLLPTIHKKCQVWGLKISLTNGVLGAKESYSLLLNCCKTFLWANIRSEKLMG